MEGTRVKENVWFSLDMLCPLNRADLGFSGLKPHRRVISPLRSLLKTNAGDGKRSIGKDGSFSFRPWLRSTFFAKPHFTVVKLRSRRLFSDLAGGTGGTGGGGGGGRRDIYPPPGDDGRYGNGVWEAIVQGLLIAFVSLNIYLSIKYPLYKYKKLDDIDDW